MNDTYYRVMALDLGKVRIGIAMSDMTRMLASPHSTRNSVSLTKDVAYVAELVEKENVKILVIGLPLNMDGSVGERAKYSYLFGERLQNISSVKIEYFDERLSSVQASEILMTNKSNKHRDKGRIDQVAATIILDNYLKSI